MHFEFTINNFLLILAEFEAFVFSIFMFHQLLIFETIHECIHKIVFRYFLDINLSNGYNDCLFYNCTYHYIKPNKI